MQTEFKIITIMKYQIQLRNIQAVVGMKSKASEIFTDFLQGLIALDEEEKKPDNLPPEYRNDPDFEGGVHFWQLQQYIVELAIELIEFESQFDELLKEWEAHKEQWGRYLGPAAIQYARNLIDDPEYQDDEFSMDWWFFHMKEDGE